MRFLTHLLPSYVLAVVLAVIFGTAALAQQRFASPEDGAKALVEAAQHPGEGRLDVIFGPGAKELLVSGDDAVDRERIEQFLRLARESNTVVDAGNGYKVLVFGAAGWRFPVPLRSRDGQWIFDLSAGRQAIIDRRIGRNELAAIGACADYVDAQKEYYSSLHDDEPVQQFARRFISSQGRHDGLWWEPANQADRSPLGDRIAAAAAEKTGEGGKPTPYHGYIYRILAGQGPAAPAAPIAISSVEGCSEGLRSWRFPSVGARRD